MVVHSILQTLTPIEIMSEQEQEIVITIDRDGAMNLETLGFVGSSCQSEAESVASALGITTSTEYKPEFHATTPQVKTKQGNRQRLF